MRIRVHGPFASGSGVTGAGAGFCALPDITRRRILNKLFDVVVYSRPPLPILGTAVSSSQYPDVHRELTVARHRAELTERLPAVREENSRHHVRTGFGWNTTECFELPVDLLLVRPNSLDVTDDFAEYLVGLCVREKFRLRYQPRVRQTENCVDIRFSARSSGDRDSMSATQFRLPGKYSTSKRYCSSRSHHLCSRSGRRPTPFAVSSVFND